MTSLYEPPAGIGLEDVLATDDLFRRDTKEPNYRAECDALLSLAEHLALSPHTILQKLVEVTLEVFKSGSAGVSLLTEEDGGQSFYWPAIAGAWKPYIGGGTPRSFGPCGVVLDRFSGQLFRHPESYFPYLHEASPPICEALLAPFFVRGKAVGTVWVVTHDENRPFDQEDMRFLTDLATFASGVYKMLRKSDSEAVPNL